MTKYNLGCCGLNCKDCPVYIATANNDDEGRQKTAEEWSKFYAEHLGKDLKLEDMNCKGCGSESSIFIGCLNCPIRKCCTEKGFSTCANCKEYETCDMLNGFFSAANHQYANNNLDNIRKDQ